MAKQLINPVERHFEKGILGIACLALIAVIVKFLVASPNQIELDNQKATPGTIDVRLAQKAFAIQESIRNANVDVEIPDPLYPKFKTTLAPLTKKTLSTATPYMPDIPHVDHSGSLVGQAPLAEVYRLPKPELTSGRSTFEVEQDNGEIVYIITNWITVSSIFDVKQQTEFQRKAYGSSRADVMFGPMEIQRRARRSDGSWNDDDWEFVDPWPAEKIDPVPHISIVKDGEKIFVPREIERNIEQLINSIQNPYIQLQLLRPLIPYPIINGTPWSFPLITPISYRDLLMQDDEYLFADQPPSNNPEDRYGLDASKATEDSKKQTLAQEQDSLLKEALRYLELSKKNHSVNDAVRAHNNALSVKKEPANPSLGKRAEKIMEDANIAEQTARIWQRTHSQQDVIVEDDAKPAREKLDLQQLWVHDARAGSIQGGKTYQYRIRANVINRMVGEPMKFADPNHATMFYISGPWSEATDPIIIPPDLEFYVTSSDNKKREIGVEFYRWFQGVWVKARRFKFNVGDQIYGDSIVDIPSPDIIGDAIAVRADFDAQATVMDIDFNRNIRDRKSSRSGIKFGDPTKDTAVVYVDRFGKLHERYVLTEKGHPSKKAVKKREYRP